mgnify:CR=1 FL=1
MVSHPTWVRGLKQGVANGTPVGSVSHPTWVRGLKRDDMLLKVNGWLSHPTWVRGLKLNRTNQSALFKRRTLRGCVD